MANIITSTFKKLFSVKAEILHVQDLNGQLNAINKVMGVIEFTPDGTIIKINENFLKVVGYAENEVIGQHHRMFAEPSFAASAEYQQFWSKLARGIFNQGQYKRIAKGNREVWLEASYNPIFDLEGKVYKVVKYATDITERKFKEVDIAGQLAAINKSQGTIELSLDGEVLTANPIFLGVLGYTLEEAVGQHHRTFVSPEYAKSQDYQDFWARLNRGEFVSGRFQRVGKGGKNIWLEASYNPILDANGKPYKVVKFATDITKQVEMEEQAKTLSLVANETDNSVVITDANGLIEYVNKGFTRLTGYTFEESVGKNQVIFYKVNIPTQKRLKEYAQI